MHRRPGLFLSFTEELTRRGLAPSSRLISASLEPATVQELSDMGLPAGAEVVRLSRVRLADGVPIALEEAALRPELEPVLGADLSARSMHQVLLELDVVATRAVGSISARPARADERRALELPAHASLLVEVRILFDQHGQVFERTEARYAAEHYAAERHLIDVVHTHP